ncbi:hypothetical protein BH09BAC6_BH09BAC6_11770 [soil metagenome]|jgi:hypothetical protein
MDLNITLKRGPEYLHNDVDNEVIMMNMNTGMYVTLNETGRSIWYLLDEPKTVSQLIAALAVEYSVTPEQCEKDVLPFIEILTDRKIAVKQ